MFKVWTSRVFHFTLELVGDILKNFALQLGFSFGLIALMGFVIWFLICSFLRLVGKRIGRRVLIATGVIGVPIHETGHLFFCIVFFHRITAVKLFQLNPKDGTLGYVRHSFNRKNIFQQIGNFFIGIGPLLFGSAVIILLMFLWTADVRAVFLNANIWHVIKSIFAPQNLINPWWWLFIILALSVEIHMSLSWSDIKGCLRGLIFIAPILFILNVLLYLFNANWAAGFTEWLTSACVLVVSFLVVAVLLLLVMVLLVSLVQLATRKKKLNAKGEEPRAVWRMKQDKGQDAHNKEGDTESCVSSKPVDTSGMEQEDIVN